MPHTRPVSCGDGPAAHRLRELPQWRESRLAGLDEARATLIKREGIIFFQAISFVEVFLNPF